MAALDASFRKTEIFIFVLLLFFILPNILFIDLRVSSIFQLFRSRSWAHPEIFINAMASFDSHMSVFVTEIN